MKQSLQLTFLTSPVNLLFMPKSVSTPVERAVSVRQCVSARVREADLVAQSPLGAPQVICCGELLYDLYAAPNTPLEDDSWRRTPGGAPANVATALARLETACAFFGIVGDDERGDSLRKELVDHKVNVQGLQRAKGWPTRTVFVRVNEDGDRSFVGCGGAIDSFADTQAMDENVWPAGLFYAAKLLVLPTFALAFNGSAHTIGEVLGRAKLYMLETVVDVNWRPAFWIGIPEEEARKRILDLIRKADIVKLSRDEVGFLFGEEKAKLSLEKPDMLLRDMEFKGVLVTDGEQGSAYAFNYGNEVIGRCNAVVPEGGVVDTTGAGDAFLAGFLSRMLHLGGTSALCDAGKTDEMMRFASATASFAVAREGAFSSMPTLKQVEDMLSKSE